MDTATEDTTRPGPSQDAAGRVEAGEEVFNTQVTSTHTSTKTSVSSSTSASQVDPESRKTSFESICDGGEKHEHLRGGDAMAPDSTKTSKRGNSRPASLDLSLSTYRSLGEPFLSSDTGLCNVTSSVATKPQQSSQEASHATNVCEPPPPKLLPNINETLGDLAPPKQGHAALAPATLQCTNMTPLPKTATPGDHGLHVNPYFRRADEIGPNHGIPGLGHIGALLTPPGWKIGDEPITDTEAEWLYDEARAQAAKLLNANVSRRGNLSSAEHLQRNDEGVEQWQRQLRIDNICLAERKWIYLKWQERKAFRSMQAQQRTQAKAVPSPLHPPTQTSIHAYQQHQQAQLPGSPFSPYTSSSPLSAGSLNNRLQYLQRGLHLPVRSPMNPSFLDPNLVPQTLDSIYAHYRANRITIMQMYDENEDFLTNWTAKFGLARPQGLPVTPIPQYMNGNGQQARPIASVHYGHDQGQNFPHPEMLRLSESVQHVPDTQVQPSNHHPYHNQYHVSGPFYPQQQEPFRAPSRAGRIPLLERPQADANRLPERTVGRPGIQQSYMGDRMASSGKPLEWHQEPVEHPYAPNATGSQGIQKTGTGANPKASKTMNATPQVVRRRKPAIDAKKGFSISTDQARRLIALGVSDSMSTRPSTARESSLPAGTVLQSTPFANVPLGNPQSSNGVARSGGPAIAGTRPGLGVSSSSRCNSPSPSSEYSDDPRDATFDVNPKRKIPAPHANAPGRKAAVAGNKRKSGTAEPAPTTKRTRMNPDGVAENNA